MVNPSPPSFLIDPQSCGGVSTQLWLTFLALGGGMTRGDKSVWVQTFLILENIAQKFLLKSPLESTHREELKSALEVVLIQRQGGLIRKGRRNPDFGRRT